MFKKILLPTDGSAAALHAAETVADRVGATQNIQVTVIAVIMPLDTKETDFDLKFIDDHNTRLCQEALQALEATTSILARHGIVHTAKSLQGTSVSAVIAQEALAGDYDLIAMSSRGMGIQKDNLRCSGGVTEHVIRRVAVPVLVVPAQAG